MYILTEYQYVHITDIVIKGTYITGVDRGDLCNRLHNINIRSVLCNICIADTQPLLTPYYGNSEHINKKILRAVPKYIKKSARYFQTKQVCHDGVELNINCRRGYIFSMVCTSN